MKLTTPLSIINGYIELINQSDDEVKKEEYLNAIQKETSQINQLVMAILELHQFDYGVKNTETGVCFWFEVN